MLTDRGLETMAKNNENTFVNCRFQAEGSTHLTPLYNSKVYKSTDGYVIEKNATISSGVKKTVTQIGTTDKNGYDLDVNNITVQCTPEEDLIVNFKYKFRRV